jgi:peptide/nickel transport system permease protein
VLEGLPGFLIRRALLALVLVLLVSSAALVLIGIAPGDHLSGFDLTAEAAAAERARLGLDRPFIVQYLTWLGRAARLDLGQSLKYSRPVEELLAERAGNTALLGGTALLLATLAGIPAGIYTGSRQTPLAALVRSLSMILMSIPPLVTSFIFLLIASQTRWLPVGGFGALTRGGTSGVSEVLWYLILPCLALALPIAAALEHLQSQSMRDALLDPSMRAALARGCSPARVVWRHALRLSLKPVIALYGVLVGSVLSGSFVVEIVMSWPGLGALTYEALVARDLYLVAGCAAVGAVFLASGVLASDIALAILDPRVRTSG